MPSGSTMLVWTRVIGRTFFLAHCGRPGVADGRPRLAPFLVDNETLACDRILRLKLLHDVSSVLSTSAARSQFC